MNKQRKASGVVLAGGLGRRMDKQDKGLIHFNNQSMISYAIHAINPVVDELFINANRNLEEYQQFKYPVISDIRDDFAGPLAGVYAALKQVSNDVLLVTPCDSPFMTSEGLLLLLAEHRNSQADIAVAFDGERVHPVFMVINCALKDDLRDYLTQGGRKIDVWFERHNCMQVDFSATPELFYNINTPEQLSKLMEMNDAT